MPTIKKHAIGVLGGGSWGTSLAHLLSEKGEDVILWARDPEIVQGINKNHKNPKYLNQYTLCPKLRATQSFQEAVEHKDVILLAIPSHAVRKILEQIIPFLEHDPYIISTSKGIENDTLMTMNELLHAVIPEENHAKIIFLSGPSFADEVIRNIPTAVTLASKEQEAVQEVQSLLSTDYFRIYTSTDVIGVELGGALKNVIAIAAGISDGLGYGHNSRAALITRGLSEIARLGQKMGANPITFLGLSGMGDLTLTCTGNLSRNRYVGMKIGQGMKLDEIVKNMKMVAEGIRTTKSVYQLSKKMNVEMVLCQKIYEILYEGADPKKVVYEIMTRTPKPEFEWFQ
jgi:glycerol-3-phosphate dehydrogenase (NAD(P)+)